MPTISRVALPGYNALTDNDPDHFSLFSDEDNVLIKRKAIGRATISDGSPNIYTVPHNLGYIPYFVVYYYDEVDQVWSILNNQYNPFSVPQQIASVDTQNLYVYNFGGHSSGNLEFVYEIYYDNMSSEIGPTITETSTAIKVVRPGRNALTSKNPNDYIMHSDLNNLKILKEGVKIVEFANLTDGFTISHEANVRAPYKYMLFIRHRNDGKTVLVGGSSTTNTYADGTPIFGSSMNESVISVSLPPQSATPDTNDVKYYIFGSGKSGTITPGGHDIAIAASGKNPLTETNPDNFNFHSKFSTLKYYTSARYTMTVSNTTVITIPHNLGYVPFFVVFVNDLAAYIPNSYCLVPYYYGRSTIGSPDRDVAAFAYADENNIYLRAYFQTNAVGTSFTFSFYYKIFKNNMNL